MLVFLGHDFLPSQIMSKYVTLSHRNTSMQLHLRSFWNQLANTPGALKVPYCPPRGCKNKWYTKNWVTRAPRAGALETSSHNRWMLIGRFTWLINTLDSNPEAALHIIWSMQSRAITLRADGNSFNFLTTFVARAFDSVCHEVNYAKSGSKISKKSQITYWCLLFYLTRFQILRKHRCCKIKCWSRDVHLKLALIWCASGFWCITFFFTLPHLYRTTFSLGRSARPARPARPPRPIEQQ